MNRVVRERFPDPEEVFIASFIDLSIVPPLYWMTVGLVLGSAYEQAAGELPQDVDPADYLVILPDWAVASAATTASATRAAAVVVDEVSKLALSYQGERPVEAVLGALEEG